MNLFKSFRLTWFQAATWKVGMLSLGIVVGARWHELLAGYQPLLVALAAGTLAYVTWIWWKQ
jgi:hypothetical protein